MFDKLLQPIANKLMKGEPKCMWTEEIALETLKFAIQWIFKYAMVFIVGVIVGAFGMWYHDKGEIDALQKELINVQAMYSNEQLAKEQALVDLALEKQKEPEKVYIQGETKTETVYVEKESPDDADVEISNPPPTIKLAYNGKEEADKKFDEYNDKVCQSNKKSQFLSGLMQPIMAFIGNFGYVAVCIVGAMLTMNGQISFGVIVAFMTYVRLFTNPLSQIAQAMTSLQSTAAASERVFDFVDEPEMNKEDNITKHLDTKDVKGYIDFENVVFKYDGNDEPTIKNFTAHAKPGQKIAIVGPTGAGKTTMVNLLMKFYDINSGDIKIDGVSTKELTRENIHDLFGMVLQDTWLFQGTIKENLRYNKDHVTDGEIVDACKSVGVDHFIQTLPQRYDTVIDDSVNLSAGQKQLLTIARTMIANNPMLILDEATSSVDTRTEELIQKAMDKLMEGRTSFIIAHRLSTIKNADIILVLKDGDVIEKGNHEELMAKGGFYANLYNSQFAPT